MTDPRTPDEQAAGPGPSSTPPEPAADEDSPTQAWPSLATPPAGSASAAPSTSPTPAPAPSTPPSTSPYEPADSLPPTRVGVVDSAPSAGAPARRRPGVRWLVAGLAVVIVAAASFAIVSLVGGRPATSVAMGYMPQRTFTYSEIRLDLPGDQRPKLASFLKVFPGFKDQSAIEPKLEDALDRLVRLASKDSQTWTTDIQPWFGGQIGFGAAIPQAPAVGSAAGMSGADGALGVVTVTDRSKAIDWLTRTFDSASLNRSSYGDADLFIPADNGSFAAAVNERVMLFGTSAAVKAALDTDGSSGFGDNDDVKAAIATVDKDYVLFTVTRLRAYADAALQAMATSQPGVLENTQLDDVVLGMIPAWQTQSVRFEADALVSASAGPSWNIGYDTSNRASQLLGHVPAKTIAFAEVHDAGPVISAILAKFRPLEETKQAFAQFDQVMNVLGGSEAAFGWFGDTALVVSPLADGTIGGGLVIHPRDAAAADRLVTTLNGFIALGGASAGVTTKSEDHNGTKVTILDLSATLGPSAGSLPPGYKAEVAWATNADVTVLGYGSTFVKEVLDAGPGTSLADDARFKGLLGRVGAENIGVTFLDIAAIRGLIEPLAQSTAPADDWSYYTKEIQPYLAPIDALIAGIRKDGGTDRMTGAITVVPR